MYLFFLYAVTMLIFQIKTINISSENHRRFFVIFFENAKNLDDAKRRKKRMA